MSVLFQPIADFVLGKYFADEAAFAKMFTDFGMSPFPAPKNDQAATKAWNAPASALHKWGGLDRPGFLTIAEGKSVKVVDQAGRGEQYVWSTPIVPPQLGQLLTNAQHDFYVEYRHHADYQQGIPLLERAAWDTALISAEWLATMNFATKDGERHLPPIDQPRLMSYGMRFKPGSTEKRLEDVEVFLIEAYRREFKPPAPPAVVVGEYQYDDVTVATMAMSALFTSGTLAEKGAAIRKAAEARK